MLEIIAWLGCAILVLKGAEIYLSSLTDEFPDFRRGASLVVLVVSVVLAGLFAFLIVREAAKMSDLEASYKDVQNSVQKSFEATSKALDATTKPVDEKSDKAVDDVIENIRGGEAGGSAPAEQGSGER